MFYSNGNYEAFIRPRKPRGVDESLPISSAVASPRSRRRAF